MTHMDKIRRVLDLHCDTLTECYERGCGLQNSDLHFSLDKLPAGYSLCQCMAVWIPDTLRDEAAQDYFFAAARLLKTQMEQHSGRISQTFDLGSVGQALAEKPFAAILTLEGGAALAGRLENIERFYDLGTRIITLTWNQENELCGGVQSGAGFKPFGKAAVLEMERLGVAVDVSHLNDKSFWQLCEFAEKPFIATHSNARAVCPHPRNLTDGMFLEIARRGGVAGLNYGKGFIREDGQNGSIDDLLRHVHHFLALGGENALALGSDYDGAKLPDYLCGVDKIPKFAESLEKSGIPRGIVDKILFENANRYLSALARSSTPRPAVFTQNGSKNERNDA